MQRRMQTRRQQRNIIIIGYVLMIPLAAMIVLTALGIDVFAALVPVDDKIHGASAETPEKAVFDGLSGMPCDNPEQFAKWYADYVGENEQYQGETEINEQKTAEEGRPDADPADQQESLPETEPEAMPETAAAVESTIPIYAIDGQIIADAGIQERLYRALESAGIEYWYEGALAQMYQESRGQVYAENPNGLDKGLYQFRAPYWSAPESIFDVDAQIRAYTQQTAARLNAGLSADDVISRHKTSDWVPEVDWGYVAQVRQWLGKMEAVK